MTVTIQARVEQEEKNLIQSYIESKGITMSEFIRAATLEKIEDDVDMEIFKKALADFEENPITYSHEEVKKELGLI
jgi:RHH-type rel operon transcriptional repressor/antitoxin RelB